MSGLEKIEKAVVEGYKKIEDGVVSGYKKVEDTVVGGFNKMAEGFVEKHLTKEGETVEEAKDRLAKEHAERMENVKVDVPDAEEIVKKNLEASKNVGKR